MDWMKRVYWKGERQAIKAEILSAMDEHRDMVWDAEVDKAIACTPDNPCDDCRARGKT